MLLSSYILTLSVSPGLEIIGYIIYHMDNNVFLKGVYSIFVCYAVSPNVHIKDLVCFAVVWNPLCSASQFIYTLGAFQVVIYLLS